MSERMKFRAWDAEVGKMAMVASIYFGVNDCLPLKVDCAYQLTEKEVYGDEGTDEGCDVEVRIRPASKLILMQFTGLLDSQGREIYESDLLKHDGHGEVTEVVFLDGSFLAKRKAFVDEYSFIIAESVEVVGNVFENNAGI